MNLETKAKNWRESLHDSEKGLENENYTDFDTLRLFLIDKYLHAYSRDNSLTKQDAIEAMELGYKVTHSSMSPNERIYLIGDGVNTELESIMFFDFAKEFWQDRNHPNFDKDWAIFYETEYSI